MMDRCDTSGFVSGFPTVLSTLGSWFVEEASSLQYMEKTRQDCTTTLGSWSKNLARAVNVRDRYSVDAVLGIVSHNGSAPSASKETLRKWSLCDGSVNSKEIKSGREDFNGVAYLGLGQPSSSCTAISSGKEMVEESSLHLGLSIEPHQLNCKIDATHPRDFDFLSPNKSDGIKPKIDLELSLSTGHSESDITTFTQGSSSFQTNIEALQTTVQLLDDGSSASRWITGPVVPLLQQKTLSTAFNQDYVSTNPAPVIQNVLSTAELVPKSSSVGTSRVDYLPKQCSASVKPCQEKGCTKGARGSSGLCIAHGGGRRCQRDRCKKGAEGKTAFCKAHGGGHRCQYVGCTRSAEGGTNYCIGHGGGRRCTHEGCTRAARGKSGLCIRHGGGKRCKLDGCTKSAEGMSGLCISHGGGRRCQYPACSKGAQGSTMFCKAHGGGKRCTFLGCTKGAEGSTPFCKGHGGGKRCTFGGCPKSVHGGTSFCVSHGGGKRCAMPECTKSARGRTNFCVGHGGGKRCKFEGCTKSAQGSTDFCKAHGGGKRCSWGLSGREFAGATQCHKFPLRRSDLIDGKHFCGGAMVGSMLEDQQKMKEIVAVAHDSYGCTALSSGSEYQSISLHNIPEDISLVANAVSDRFSLPEGRVHGGSFMTMLTGSATLSTHDRMEYMEPQR